MQSSTLKTLLTATTICSLLYSCSKKDIQFGLVPEETYTNFFKIDTVEASLSTVLLDSFATNGKSTFLLGTYRDAYLGKISTRPFFKIAPPPDIDLPSYAVFDSLTLVLPLSHYSYGDTTKSQTVQVHELNEELVYMYGSSIYNTSNFSVKAASLGEVRIMFRPNLDDSIVIRLNDARGKELLEKLKARTDDIKSSEEFQKYCKGLRLQFSSDDSAAVYGLNSSGIKLRLHYHQSTPVLEDGFKELPIIEDSYRFNQIITDRGGTGLPNSVKGLLEITSAKTGNAAFSQPTAGALLKVTFPSLRNILLLSNVLRLLKAELIVRPIEGSYTKNQPLPSSLYLYQTDATNSIGSAVADSSSNPAAATPNIDAIYRVNTHYQFEITTYINNLLATAGTTDQGFYIIEEVPGNTAQINKSVIGNRYSNYKTELLLTVLTVNE